MLLLSIGQLEQRQEDYGEGCPGVFALARRPSQHVGDVNATDSGVVVAARPSRVEVESGFGLLQATDNGGGRLVWSKLVKVVGVAVYNTYSV